MKWIADLHIHSHFSMATSKDCNPNQLHRWAGLKGISLVGTGDFTHPGWRKELQEQLIPAEPGFYQLVNPPPPEIPNPSEVRFVVSGELSTIYKKNDKTRKVHHLILLPSLEMAEKISTKLETLGMNVRSDGRPILGLDSYHLLNIVLEICPETIYIPAHIWTPHFSVFGSNSGFDDIYECYEDLTDQIFALETGLSSDPAMNWRWSALDRFTLVSNSDAHNPQNLAREANLLDADFSYRGLKNAIQKQGDDRFLGTIEFFPEEGKYHYDGHRNCEICWDPFETRKHGGICPKCGKKVTVGVFARVTELADRPDGFKPADHKTFQSLVPLRQIIGDAFNVGAASQKVERQYFSLLQQFGPELLILQQTAIPDLEAKCGPLLATAIQRIRNGQIEIKPGYDGEYGVVSVFTEAERRALQGQTALFDGTPPKKTRRVEAATRELLDDNQERIPKNITKPATGANTQSSIELNREQLEIIHSNEPKICVNAGPGSGKTRVLVEKIIYLIQDLHVNPGEITAVTFTHKAAAEIKERVRQRLANTAKLSRLNIGTFHGLAWKILNSNPEPLQRTLIDQNEAKDILEEPLRNQRIPKTASEAALIISQLKNSGLEKLDATPPQVQELFRLYQERLNIYQRWDYDDLMLEAVKLWSCNPEWLQPLKVQFRFLFVDEFQDLNHIQYHWVKYWAKDSQQIMVIGDPNQSIYGFRGSSNQYFKQFEEDFSELAGYRLIGNYRSPKTIVNAANGLIEKEYHQVSVNSNDITETIHWIEGTGEKQAARAIVAQIGQLLGGSSMLSAHGQSRASIINHQAEHLFSLSDMVILYRTGRQAEILEEEIKNAGLPYRVVGQTRTLESISVKEFLIFFRYLLKQSDFYLFQAVIKQPQWGFNFKEIQRLTEYFLKNKNLFEPDLNKQIVESLGEQDLVNKYLYFSGTIQYFQAQLPKNSVALLEEWILRLDLAGQLEMEQFLKISENYPDLEDFLRFLPLAEEADLSRHSQNKIGTEAITLSTIHASKGLEYPVVFIYQAVEGLIPLGNNPNPMVIAEEERLFYVALTRAQKELYLVNSSLAFRNGEIIPVAPSRFIQKIPAELLKKIENKREYIKEKQLELF